jgi:hypothetical protein
VIGGLKFGISIGRGGAHPACRHRLLQQVAQNFGTIDSMLTPPTWWPARPIAVARAVAPHMVPARNRSRSFQVLQLALQDLEP